MDADPICSRGGERGEGGERWAVGLYRSEDGVKEMPKAWS